MIVSQGFDGRQFQQFARDLEAVGRAYGKSQKKFLRQEGSKLLRKTKARARALGTKTGNYKKSIKRGKVYRYNGADAVRVYSSAPHALLIEEGHRMVGFVRGHHVFELAAKEFEGQFYTDLDEYLEEAVDIK